MFFLLKSKTESLFSKSELCTHVRIIRVNITIGKPPNTTMGFNPTGEFHFRHRTCIQIRNEQQAWRRERVKKNLRRKKE